jgi:hypothetical protein
MGVLGRFSAPEGGQGAAKPPSRRRILIDYNNDGDNDHNAMKADDHDMDDVFHEMESVPSSSFRPRPTREKRTCARASLKNAIKSGQNERENY